MNRKGESGVKKYTTIKTHDSFVPGIHTIIGIDCKAASA